jgi:predicted Zn-dependent peptidase
MPRDIQTHIFPNGFRLIHESPSNKLGICALQVFVDFGSAHETDETRGMAHFIEHMCFKGTKHFPNPLNVFKKQDNIGGTFNAFTNQRYTVYISKLKNEELNTCISLFAEMMLYSEFRPIYTKMEQHIVIEECLRSEDDASSVLLNDSLTLLYEGSSFQYPIDHISYHKKKYNHRSLVDLYHLFYRPENMIMSVVTEIPFHTIVRYLQESQYVNIRLKKPNLSDVNKHRIFYSPMVRTSSIRYHLHEKKNAETTHISLFFSTCDQSNEDKHTLELLKHVLGGTFGNKLFILLREENGLTYNSKCFSDYNEFSGYISLYVQVNKIKVMKNGNKPGVLGLLIGLLNQLLKHGITLEELNIAKRNKDGIIKLALESLDNQAEHNGKEWLLYRNADEIVPIKHYYKTFYKDITRKEIHNVIKKYIKKESMMVCMVGPNLPSQNLVDAECKRIVQ